MTDLVVYYQTHLISVFTRGNNFVIINQVKNSTQVVNKKKKNMHDVLMSRETNLNSVVDKNQNILSTNL